MADNIAGLYPGHSLENIPLLSNKLTGNFNSEEEKFRAIYKWVCENITNDYQFMQRHAYKTKKLQDQPTELAKWNQAFSKEVFQKLCREHKTVCTGYAALVKELAFHAGLECEIINGYGRTAQSNIGGEGLANHSWNAIRLDDQWYLCDPTWSSGVVNPQLGIFIPNFNEAYYLPDPTLFSLNHFPLDTAWFLIDDKPTLKEFLEGPLIYSEALNHQIFPIYPSVFEAEIKKGDTISFQFQAQIPFDIEQIRLLIVNGNSSQLIEEKVEKKIGGNYSINYQFKNRGEYVVHLKLNDDYLISYLIKVLK